jgi:hypothetical protein
MAIGEDYSAQSGTGKRNVDNSYYPRFFVTKDQGTNRLSFEFRSGLLQVKIVNRNSDGFSFDNEHPSQVIYLSPTKATLLAGQIVAFKEYLEAGDIDENKAFGVNGGMGEKVSFIAFHADSDKNVKITIGKFDGNGVILEKDTALLNKDYNYALEWDNLEKMDINKVYNNNIELDQIYHLINDFGRAMNGAYAYSVADLTRFDRVRILNKMDPIYDKLGIERLNQNGSYSSNKGTNNFLNNVGRSESKSYESIEDMLD